MFANRPIGAGYFAQAGVLGAKYGPGTAGSLTEEQVGIIGTRQLAGRARDSSLGRIPENFTSQLAKADTT